jgi:hypothetical protein
MQSLKYNATFRVVNFSVFKTQKIVNFHDIPNMFTVASVFGSGFLSLATLVGKGDFLALRCPFP